MPELPDITVYITSLERHIGGAVLDKVRLFSPFILRTVAPPITAVEGQPVRELRRLGKRIVLGFPDELFMVIHLMIAGRLYWRARDAKPPGKRGLVAFDFPDGTLMFTEAATKKRASLHLVEGEAALAAYDPGGLEILDCGRDAFATALTAANHTLKRALTDPRTFSGIGNAYSDEILHRAGLSPIRWTQKLTGDEITRLYAATQAVMAEWIDRLTAAVGDGFPEKVTAFHPEMAVHGRYRQPCPVCDAPVQRIAYAANETNYCARCQNDGKLLADRSLSRLLKADWPRTLEELEELRPTR